MRSVENRRSERREDRERRAALLLKMAELHLDRVTTLSNREWQTKIIYWGALLASGAALIGSASRANPAVANAIAHWDFLIVTAYYVSASVYLVGYSGNMHQSLVTERNRYQLMQDAAAELNDRHTPFQIRPYTLDRMDLPFRRAARKYDLPSVFGQISRSRIFSSGVWGVKVIGTALFITSIWTLSQVTAHAQYIASRHRDDVCSAYRVRHPGVDLSSTASDCDRIASWQPLRADAIVLRCAFMICEDQPRPALTDWRRMELGTIIAAVMGALFLTVGLAAWLSSSGP